MDPTAHIMSFHHGGVKSLKNTKHELPYKLPRAIQLRIFVRENDVMIV